jgi:ABC-type branched-subunit amino acid transport system substrate-binding protein
VYIGLMTSDRLVRGALQAAIDATHQEGMPRIVVSHSRGAKKILPVQENDGPLANALNDAFTFARDQTFVAVVGPSRSRDALVVGPVFREAGIAFVMPTANSPQIAGLAPTGLSLAPSLDEEADFIAEFVAIRLRARTALLFYAPEEWGSGLQRLTAAALWFRGIRVLDAIPVSTWTCHQGLGPESPPARPAGAEAALRRHQPEVVILATRDEATACLAEVIQRLVPGMPMVSGDGTEATPAFATRLEGAAEYLYSVTFWHHEHSPSTGVFGKRLAEDNGAPPTLSQGMIFEATMLLVRAIREAGASREVVRRYLADMSRSGELLRQIDDTDEQLAPHPRLLMLQAGVPIGAVSAEISRHLDYGMRP